ncbi:type II secretion system F family protein [Inmirania thermothiophila]|uniref:MSHA biogenesis protein MshG n=1 Tax=Inmirania thermothiophila TaxID=1750597 RepID=A0A3N1Y9B5_9GAMM|nr:type II secretion system F family protein [Inmirania thermothiophila]ROR34202.1 MSHA biogenesis protein MshG [Inmirania thermothiophila]
MARYRYRGRDRHGAVVEGVLEGPSAEAVAERLLGEGLTPVAIEAEVTRAPRGDLLGRLFERGPGLDELILFSRQMYSLLKAGVPILRAMRGLVETTRSARMRQVLEEIAEGLESGRSVSACLARHPEVFSSLYVAVVAVGENAGRLDEAFSQMADTLERERETRQRIRTAMRYPVIVLSAIAIAVFVINLFVIPAFSRVFAGFQMELPWATRVLLAVSAFFTAWWPHLLVAAAVAVAGLRRYVATEAGRLRWDRLKLHLPVVGSIILRATLARFARSFALCQRSGVPLLATLTAVARAVDNRFVEGRILAMREGVERGDTLTRTARATGLFTPLVIQMVAVGEETGAVDDMLAEVADFYEREVDYELKYLSDAIEPILIVAVGVMVLILALGVFLPMWELTSLARRG